ncbi:MAG: ribosome small subunit-dependent GTPase A [bacterium]|nr:ribosome small subunit-dependent GTPase A [bacterium]
MQLLSLGWNSFFYNHYDQYRNKNYAVMRIIRENKGKYIAVNEDGEFLCILTGKFKFKTKSKSNFPTVGDWIVVSILPNEKKAIIHVTLPRKSAFIRKVTGNISDEQVIVANIDTVFIVVGLDLNFNLRRIERYLSMALKSGATPVILLNKSDICPEVEFRKKSVERIANGVAVHIISAVKSTGLEILKNYIKPGKTASFLGSSGVGKSTIINALLHSEYFKVKEVSKMGSRGRHTTTFKELLLIPGGGIVIDTPGIKEIQVCGDQKGLKLVFDDIEKLALNCQFRNCSHIKEINCAVKEALNNGSLKLKRFESYLKLKKEFSDNLKRKVSK